MPQMIDVRQKARAASRTHICRALIAIPVFLAAVAPALAGAAGSATVRTAFREDCQSLLIEQVGRARSNILVAAFSFTSRDIADALVEAQGRGVEVRVKIDRHHAEEDYTSQLIGRLRNASISVKTIAMPEYYSMHNKFLVIDGERVLTGSYNFTVAASKHNWENLVCIESEAVARKFAREWDAIKTRK